MCSRVSSFYNRMWLGPVSPHLLTQSGFMYTGVDDKAMCVQCKLQLVNWGKDLLELNLSVGSVWVTIVTFCSFREDTSLHAKAVLTLSSIVVYVENTMIIMYQYIYLNQLKMPLFCWIFEVVTSVKTDQIDFSTSFFIYYHFWTVCCYNLLHRLCHLVWKVW